jgi:hypothetical protein
MGRRAAVTDGTEMVSAGRYRDFGLSPRELVEFVERSLVRRVDGICLVADHERIVSAFLNAGTNAICRGDIALRLLRTAHGTANFSGECLGASRGQGLARQPASGPRSTAGAVHSIANLIRFFPNLLPSTFSRQGLLDSALCARFQVEGVALHFLNDLFRLNLTLESTESVVY